MSAYLVFARDKTVDQQEMDAYAKEASDTLAGHPAKPLAFYGAHQDLEGPSTEGIVMIEFPTIDAAKGWYNSPSYRQAREHRFKGATYRVTLAQGV